MKQPEALRLAEQLRDLSTMFETPSHEKGVCNGASFEIRRLHEEIQRVQYVNKTLEGRVDLWMDEATLWSSKLSETEKERDRLHEANQAMLEALKAIAAIEMQMNGSDWDEITEAQTIAEAAIAKGEAK